MRSASASVSVGSWHRWTGRARPLEAV